MSTPLRIGLSMCFDHADPTRKLFTGKTLLYVEQSMLHWVGSSGSVVYPVPAVAETAPLSVDAWVDDLDGLVLHGGADVCPRTYGEAPLRPEWEGDAVRDGYEIDLVRRFAAAGKPVLGICRGAQVLNVAHGGTLHQDIATQVATTRTHRDAVLYDHNLHEIDVVAGSRLATLAGSAGIHRVNSIHHQAVKDLGEGLVVEARSADDGVVEAIRVVEGPWALGVQWHPEFFDPADATLLDNRPILDDFLAAAAARRAS